MLEEFDHVLSVFHEARADLAEQWNAERATLLPPELLAECLDALNRVMASSADPSASDVVYVGQLLMSCVEACASQIKVCLLFWGAFFAGSAYAGPGAS